jgi:hypothetical protein
MLHPMGSPNQLIEWQRRKKFFDCKTPNRNEELRSDDFQLTLEPVTAPFLLLARRYTISATSWMWTRVTTRNSRDVDILACGFFGKSAPGQPAEQCFSRPPGKGFSACSFNLARCLTDEHHLRVARGRHYRTDSGSQIAAPALAQPPAMCLEHFAFRFCSHL